MSERRKLDATLEGLRAEFDIDGFGHMWLGILRSACHAQSRKYPPQLYGAGEVWNQQAVEDLVQDVAERLVTEEQMAYIVDVAVDVGHVRALITTNVKWTLAARRQRTAADNLLERAHEILESPPFVRCVNAVEVEWALDGKVDRLTAEETRSQLLSGLRSLPRYPGGATRQTSVWSRETLQFALERVLHCFGSVKKSELRDLFREVLTSADFAEVSQEDVGINEGADGLSPDEQTEALFAASDLLCELTSEERAVLRGKWAGQSDQAIGESIGRSRPTVDKLKKAAEQKVRDVVGGLNERVSNDVLRRIFTEFALKDDWE